MKDNNKDEMETRNLLEEINRDRRLLKEIRRKLAEDESLLDCLNQEEEFQMKETQSKSYA